MILIQMLAAAALAAPPSVAPPTVQERAVLAMQMSGIWKGTFRRFDPQGALVETLPSTIIVCFSDAANAAQYHQTNILTLADGKGQRIETFGTWDGRFLRFASARVDGRYGRAEVDPSGLTSVLFLAFKDPSRTTMSEIITLSRDGRHRMRAAQYVTDGKLSRRTLVDEEKSDQAPACR